MTDLFSGLDSLASVPLAAPAPPDHDGRKPTQGEHGCNRCGFAACFFDGQTPWCRTCAPAEFRPGRAS